MAKDSVFALFVVLVIFTMQIGFYNSCWCRSNVISLHKNAYINLNRYSDPELWRAKLLWCCIPLGGLIVNWALILWIEHHGGSARGPLCKSQRKLQEHLELLEECKALLKSPAQSLKKCDVCGSQSIESERSILKGQTRSGECRQENGETKPDNQSTGIAL